MSHDSLVPEPSVVIPELQINHEIDNKEDISEATPPPPSPFTTLSTTDVQPIIDDVSSLVSDKIVPLPKKESEEIFLRKNSEASTDTNNVTVEKVEDKKELFSVSAKIIPDPNYNGKETDVDDDDEDEDNKDLYHSTLVTTCVDSDEDNTADYDLEVPNESFGFRPQPVGCSSDSPTSSSASSNIVYDSLEDEPKSKRSLPALPKDHDLQQKRAYEIFRQHWVPSVEDVDLTSTPVNDQDRLIEGRSEDNYEYNYHLNLPAKRQLPKPPPVSPLIFDKDSGCASLENNHQQQKRNSPEPPNFLWVGLEDSKQELKKKQPKNHERLNATKKKLKPKNKESKSKINPDRQYFMGKRVKILKVGVFPSNRNIYVDFIK